MLNQSVTKRVRKMFKLLVIAAMATVALGDPMRGRIVGGESVNIKDAPYQALLLNNGDGFCGATIISEKWLLTTADCVEDMDEIKVRAGNILRNYGGSIYEVEKVIQHENFTRNTDGFTRNDIAVVKLKSRINYDSTKKPIKLFKMNEKAVPGRNAVITGWGLLSGAGIPSDRLQKVTVPVISKEKCNAAYLKFGGLSAGHICTGYPQGGKGTCHGDSGGPMTIDRRLAGIISGGFGCAKAEYPTVYTEVAFYRNWIHHKTGI